MAEQFYTLLTSIGKAKIANANALGNKVNFTTLKVGDGNGSYYEPTETQQDLVHTVWQGNINSVTVDSQNSNWLVIEIVIPSSVGGFMIREAGIFDSDGSMLAVAKYPETYKPQAEDGSTKDLTVRIILEITNSSSVTLKIDPTVTLATKDDLSKLAGEGNTTTVKALADEVTSHKAENATLTTKGHVQLQTTVDTSETKALTPKALNDYALNNVTQLASKADKTSMDICFQDILKIKMRQSGLNLDTNAWSDTLEDISGINASVSSNYQYDSINKLLRVIPPYNIKYECDSLPQNATPVWSISENGGSANVNSGILNISAAANLAQKYTMSLTMDTTKSKSFKIKFKVATSSSGGFGFGFNDGQRNIVLSYLHSAGEGLCYYNGSSNPIISNTTGIFTDGLYHEVEIKINGTTDVGVYIDGNLKSTLAYTAFSATSNSLLYFGAYDTTASNVYIDYIYVSTDFIQTTNTATIIWNALTSNGTLTKAIVESIQSLGTGTITYYISRDNGTTFIQATLDTVTVISSQPSGSSIVLKAVITGDAELMAVAWGGEI